MKSKLVLLLAILMGIITTFLFYNYTKNLDKEKYANNQMVNILAAKQNIKENQKLSKEMIDFVQVPQKNAHAQSIKDFKEIEGLYTTSEIAAGEPILKHRVQSKAEEKTKISRKIKEGYKGVSVGVNIVQSVTNLIEPEDFVDVVFNEEPPKNSDLPIKTELLLENVRVLAVGRRMVESKPEDAYVEYTSVTLELKQEDAVKLVNAQERGNIYFILRSRLIP